MLSPRLSRAILALVALALSACGSGSQVPSHAPDCGATCSAVDATGSTPDTSAADLAALDLAADLSADLAPDTGVDVLPDASPNLAPDAPSSVPDATPDGSGDLADAGPGTIGLAPALHEFMGTAVGKTDTFTFTVTNLGGNTLPGLSLAVNGADFAIAATSLCAGVALNAGASCHFDVVFKPASRGVKSGTLVVSASGQTVTAALVGTGLTPPQLAISPQFASFVGQVGKTGAPVDFVIANVGNLPTGLAVSLSGGDFIVTSNGCLVFLGPGAGCQVQVAFKPFSVGMKTGSLWAMALSSGSMVQSQLSGTAVAPGALTITPDSATFTPVAVGATSLAKDFVVKNTGGTATAPLTAVVTTGEYVITANACGGMSLPANGTCTVSVAFKPSSVGTKLANLTVSGAAGETGSAALTGTTP